MFIVLVFLPKACAKAKNLEVGKKAIYKDRKSGRTKKVKLDSPERGGNKKFIVYRNTGRTDKETGEIVAKKIEWGDPGLSVKNDDPGRAKSFWARHQCDQKKIAALYLSASTISCPVVSLAPIPPNFCSKAS